MQTLRLIALVVLIAPPLPAQWTYVSSGTTAELRGLSAPDGRVAWASGARGTVLRSVDGGRTWVADTIAGAAHLDFRSVHAHSDAAAVIASAGEAEKGLARMFSTGDAGRHWNECWTTDTRGVFLDAIGFWDLNHGIALSDPVDGRFFVLTTSDGGRTWARLPPAQLPEVLPGEAAFAASGTSIALVAPSHVWIGTGGGGRARVMHSPDRGRTWSVTETPAHAVGSAAGIFSIAFLDTLRGVAAGGDYTRPALKAPSVTLTDDGGRTWRVAADPPAAYLSGVSYAGDARRLVAVGLAGTFVSRDGGERWTQTDTMPLNSVRFHGRRGLAVGPRGRVAYTDSIP